MPYRLFLTGHAHPDMSLSPGNPKGHQSYPLRFHLLESAPGVAVSIPLPPALKKRGWKVKVRDRERVEPPHVTVLWKTRAWRWGLRERDFLDTVPDPANVPAALVDHLLGEDVHRRCVEAWDRAYPHNPVRSTDDDED